MNTKHLVRTKQTIETLGSTLLKTDEERGHAFLMRYLIESDEDGRSARQNTREYIYRSPIQDKIYIALVTIVFINYALYVAKIIHLHQLVYSMVTCS